MTVVDVAQNTYRLVATLSNGSTMDITNAIEDLDWADQRKEIAQRATIRLARLPTSDGRHLNEALPLCTQLQIFGNGEECFRGIIWEWEYESGDGQSIALTAYDRFIYAQKSKDNFWYKKGTKTQTVITDICKKWGIPLRYEWESIKHEKWPLRGVTIADGIISTLEKARLELDKKYAAIYVADTLVIKARGLNEDVFAFISAQGGVADVSHKITLDQMVTKVIVTGKGSKKTPVKATVTGDTRFGVIQDIVQKGSMSLKKAKKEAQTLIRERGKPEHTIQVTAPDIPTIRKGDMVKVVAGSLDGFYVVLGVTHSAATRSMVMELDAVKGDAA